MAILKDRIDHFAWAPERSKQEARLAEVQAIATRLAVLEWLETKQQRENAVSGMNDDEIAFHKVGDHHERVLPDGRIQRLVTRKSMMSGREGTRIFTATLDQWALMDKGELVQIALPHLTDGDREFLITGITDEEWDTLKPPPDEAPDGAPGGSDDDEPAF